MRQRCKIAQALAHQPELLILDEPFTGADPVARHDLTELLRHLATEGVDILISSHVLHEVEALTRRILMIDRGRIVAEGELQTVRQQLRNRPHAVRVRAQQPRAIAAELAWLDSVSGVKIAADDSLIIETSNPPQVYDRITAFVIDHKLDIQELAAADESLEAVFGYLTDRSV
jgi:ABC-2 type transport system ATP-binding protein